MNRRPLAVPRTLVGLLPALALVPPHLLLMRFSPARATRLRRWFHARVGRALGLRIRVSGRPSRERPTLYVANHLSWSDVPVLGALVDGRFIAKADVEADGLVGWFAGLQRTLYVDRDRRADMDRQRRAMSAALAAGDNLILFPEGTTSDGRATLPFRSALLSALEAPGGAAIAVQPVSIAYSAVNGIPVSRHLLPLVVWLGEVPLGAHMRALIGLGRVRVDVVFHPPVRLAAFAGRKALAASLQATVAAGYEACMRGFISGAALSISALPEQPARPVSA